MPLTTSRTPKVLELSAFGKWKIVTCDSALSAVMIGSPKETIAKHSPLCPLPEAELVLVLLWVPAGTEGERGNPRPLMLNAVAGKRMLAQGLNSVNCLLRGLRSVVGGLASSHSPYPFWCITHLSHNLTSGSFYIKLNFCSRPFCH